MNRIRKTTRVDIRRRWAGCVNSVRSAPNGSWIEVELLVQGPAGGFTKHVFAMDLFDASEIVRVVHYAIGAQRQHLDRIQARTDGGY